MTVLTFTLVLICSAFLAGLLGSLTGLGGGVVVIPILTLCFHVDFHYAIGAALIASIATSSGSASAYVKEGITNIRLGMFLEIATTIGAVGGAFIALWMPTNIIAVIFGVVLMFTAIMQQRRSIDQSVKQNEQAMQQSQQMQGVDPNMIQQVTGASNNPQMMQKLQNDKNASPVDGIVQRAA